MYGSDNSNIGTLAATGLAGGFLGITGQIVAAAVIIIAGLAIVTVTKVLRDRKIKRSLTE